VTVIVKDAVTDVFLFRMKRVSNVINHPSLFLFFENEKFNFFKALSEKSNLILV